MVFVVYQRDLLLCVTVVTLCAAVRFVALGYGAVVFSSEILFLYVTVGSVVSSGEIFLCFTEVNIVCSCEICCVLRWKLLGAVVRFVVVCCGGKSCV